MGFRRVLGTIEVGATISDNTIARGLSVGDITGHN